jgi:23S rRNA (uracil1939-C5)-methyltransferase
MRQGSRKGRPAAAAATEQRRLRIAQIGAQGDGAGRDEAGALVYAPFTLPGERVLAEVSGDRGRVIELLEPSPERAEPPCPHFGECGGCALQHWAQAPYLAWKASRIVEALARERLETEILPTAASPPGSRRRLALHARPGSPGSARLGYKARSSWRLVEIKACTIADPRLQAALPGLRRLAACFLEHPRSAPTLHVTATDTGLDVEVTGVERRTGGLSADARLQAAEAAQAMDAARVSLAGEILYQARRPIVRIGRAAVALPAGAFLQATPQGEAAMAGFAAKALAGAAKVADLFSGVGTFTLRLAETAQVHAADGSAEAVAALLEASGSASGLKAVTAEARDLFRRPLLAQDLKRFDAALFDPPRAGAEAQATELARSGLERIVGVSCNPATFARDARTLVDGGFRLERVLPVDQFLWSPHVELAGLFSRGI